MHVKQANMKIFQKHEIHDFMSTNSYIVNLCNFM